MRDRLEWIIRNSEVSAEDVCSLVLGRSHGCGNFRTKPWNVNIPPPDPHGSKYRSSRSPARSISIREANVQAFNITVPQPQQSVNQKQLNPPLQQRALHIPQQQQQLLHQNQQLEKQLLQNEDGSSGSLVDRIDLGKGKPVLKVLHLTDPHFDPDYRIGSNAVCEAPLCCNSDSGSPRKFSDAAGKWGDYRNCDSPRWLLQNMLHHIVTTHPDIDYVLCTGDLVPHHIWKISRQENVAVISEMTEMLLGFFPNAPIYGSIGNHESFPRDSFPPPENPEVWQKFGNQWLYDSISEQWSHLMREPVPPSARQAGHFSVLIRPGFRIISINTNFCYRLNWWILYKSVDPGLLLRWLVRELQMAESKGELVHIIGHLPPYYADCYDQWAHQFNRVVSRYSHIIRGQFYGHSHYDEFRIHYDMKSPSNAVGIEYISPNNGPFHDLNPSYRIFYIDGDHPETTRNVLDYETWVMNLTHANVYDAPHWYKLYSAKEDLELPSLEPRHWDNLVKRMARDPQLFARYYRYMIQDSDMEKDCDRACKRKTLCSIVDGDKMMPQKCRARG
ncbi:Sphingomyelin phosphodiesterase [Halocaridina rubra]|uniref:Sphingomyelin phosphodiesterase n=1 Tax=Halocaridina rubra TaxID=373956 RepID=A0AAN8X0G1_HALRR